MFYTTTFKVRGSGTFPIDMLRYDSCYPDHSSDAQSIALDFQDHDFSRSREVYLSRNHPYKEYHLTPDRWRSFGWECVVPRKGDGDMKTGTVKR